MAKRDYYEVLGISKDASKDEIKKRIESFRKNIIQILTKKKVQMKSLKKFLKPMKFLVMIINAQAMINLDMTVHKVLVDKDSMALTLAVLVASVAVVLKISLALSSVAADKEIQMHRKR